MPPGHSAIYNNLAAPILFQGNAIGLFNLANKKGGYTENDQRILDGIATRVAPVLYVWIQQKLNDDARKRTEQTLQQECAFSKAVIESAADGICVCHKIQHFPYVAFTVWNQRMTELTGYSMEEINSSGWYQSLYPNTDLRERARRRMDRMRLGDDLKAEEWHITRRDGKKRTVSISTSLLYKEADEVHVLAVIQDVTDKKRTDEYIRLSKKRSELLAMVSEQLLRSEELQSAMDEICRKVMQHLDCQLFFNYLVELPGNRMRLNAYAGISEEEAAAVRDLDFGVAICGCAARDCRSVTAEDIQSSNDAGTERVKSFGVQAYCCHPLISKNRLIGTLSFGTRTRTRFSAEEVALMKSVTDLVSVTISRLQDELSLRRSREDLDRAQKVGRIGSWRLDVKNNILTWSEENHRIFGIPEGTHLTYQTFLERVHPDDRQYVEEKWKACMRGEPYDIQHRIVLNNQEKWVREKAFLEFDDAGKVSAGFGITQDISERKAAEAELENSRNKLEERVKERTKKLYDAIGKLKEQSRQIREMAAELTLVEHRERQRMAQILHDDLQQILVGATFHLELLENDEDDPDRLNQIREMLREAIATSRSLASDLSPPILTRGDLCIALEWLTEWMREKHGLEATVTACTCRQPIAMEIRLLFFQATRELLLNIVKHAGVRKANIEVLQKNRNIRLTIEDKGVGFNPKNMRIRGGVSGGFGLFSIQERLAFLGGEMTIDSSPGLGSRFILTAPLSTATKEFHRTPGTTGGSTVLSKIAAPGGSSGLKVEEKIKIRIMLVDDHEVVRNGVASLIRREPDFEIVSEASDGESAVNSVRKARPDVVLMDVDMPVMDGIEATRIIHEEFAGIRIVGFSIHDNEAQRKAMLQAGASDYVTKSGSAKDLIKTLRTRVQ